jgi:hypothetical protein
VGHEELRTDGCHSAAGEATSAWPQIRNGAWAWASMHTLSWETQSEMCEDPTMSNGTTCPICAQPAEVTDAAHHDAVRVRCERCAPLNRLTVSGSAARAWLGASEHRAVLPFLSAYNSASDRSWRKDPRGRPGEVVGTGASGLMLSETAVLVSLHLRDAVVPRRPPAHVLSPVVEMPWT